VTERHVSAGARLDPIYAHSWVRKGSSVRWSAQRVSFKMGHTAQAVDDRGREVGRAEDHESGEHKG
jgi:hypothetical protein